MLESGATSFMCRRNATLFKNVANYKNKSLVQNSFNLLVSSSWATCPRAWNSFFVFLVSMRMKKTLFCKLLCFRPENQRESIFHFFQESRFPVVTSVVLFFQYYLTVTTFSFKFRVVDEYFHIDVTLTAKTGMQFAMLAEFYRVEFMTAQCKRQKNPHCKYCEICFVWTKNKCTFPRQVAEFWGMRTIYWKQETLIQSTIRLLIFPRVFS